MSGTRRNGIRVCVVVEVIFMLAIQGNHLVSSSTPTASSPQPGTEGNRSLTAYACEGHELTISCRENGSLQIEYANFGRLSREICNPENHSNWITNCPWHNSTPIVRSLCSGKSSCTVWANNSVFEDPCKGTPKYLGVIHHCDPATEISTTVTARTSNFIPTTNAASTSATRTISTIANGTIIPTQVTQTTARYSPINTPVTTTIRTLNFTGSMTTSDTDLITSSMKRESSTTVSSYNGPKCLAERQRDVNWMDTPANSTASAPCPNNPNLNNAKRTCGSQAKWTNVPDMSDCVSEEMLQVQSKMDILKSTFSLDGVHELMEGLESVSQNEDLYGGDLVLLTKVMVEAIDLTERKSLINVTDAQRINEVVLNTTSNLLQPDVTKTWMDLPRINQSSTATRLLCVVESSSALLANSTDESLNYSRTVPGLDVLVQVTAATPTSAAFNIGDQKTDSAMLSVGRMTAALYDGIAQWLHVNDSAIESPSDTTTTADLNSSSSAENDFCSEATAKTVVNTRVMSISIVSRSKKGAGLKQPVQYTLEHKQENFSNPVCVFWKYSKETFEGHWSGEGCRKVSSNSTHTICECDHLTNFAVLMSISCHKMTEEHAFALSVITYIGCTISIICLALAFITFCWFKGLQCDRNTIHKNLVLCLFISEVIFLLGIGQHGHKVLCDVVTGFLHYFFLASFSWMCLEGVQIYVLFIEVFEAEKSRLKWYYPSAYGVPAVIVIISAAVTRAQGNSYHAAEEYCWLTRKNGLIWAFVGPVVAIIAVNWVMLGVAIRTMYKHTSTSTSWKQKSRIETIRSFVRGAVLLMILLGSTWTFGFLYIGKNSLFMAYIFTILNSLQGLFIFIFHCLIDEKVRKEYRRCIQRCTWLPEAVRIKYGGLSGSATLSTTPNQSNSSGVPMFFRMLKNRKRDNNLSSSSLQKSSNDFTKKEGSSSSSAFSHKVKRHASSTSESAMLTESSGIPSNGYLYDHDESHVDENVFSGPDMVEVATMKKPT